MKVIVLLLGTVLVLSIFGCSKNPTSSEIEIDINIPDDYSTIQEGINAAINGDIILIQPGIYVENINFIGKSIMVASLFLTTQDTSYISQTIIDGNQNGSVVTFESGESSTSVLSGLTITNGNGYAGGGIYCSNSSPSIDDLIITGNFSIGGGGIGCNDLSSPTIVNVAIVDNSSNNGGGISCFNASPIIQQCLIKDNSATYDGGGLYFGYNSSDSIAEYVIIENNSCEGRGGGVWCSQTSPTMINATIVDNIANIGEGLYSYNNAAPTLINNIVWNTTSSHEQIMLHETASIIISYSNLQGGWEGTGNIDANPDFVDPDNGDYHLQSTSPCIDAGDPNSPLDPDGTIADMGAYYFIN